MSWVVVGVGVASIAYSAFSSGQAADAQRAAAARQRQIDEMNAQFIEKEANTTEVYGQTQAAEYNRNIDDVLAGQKLAMTKDNVDVNFGTAQVQQEEARVTGFLNTLQIQNAARQKAAGLREQAALTRIGAGYRQDQANAEAAASERAGYGQAIQGAFQVAGYAKGK